MRRVIAASTVLVLGLALAACPPAEPEDPQAIEITGYLDSSRVSFTEVDGHVQAVGQPQSTAPEAVVVLTNQTSGAVAESSANALGGFVVAVAAVGGDVVELSVHDAPDEDRATHEVPADRHPFPTPTEVIAYVPHDEDHVAVIEVTFDTPLEPGHVWASNPATSDVAVLDVFDGGRIHGGHLEAVIGDWLLLHWVPEGGEETQGFEVQVTDPPL